jgi:hypothetical protein
MRRSLELRVRVRRRRQQQQHQYDPPAAALFGFSEGRGPPGGRPRPYNLFVRLPRSVAVELQVSAASSTVAPDEDIASSSAVSRGSSSASSWIDAWFRHGTDRCDATGEDIEFLPLRIEFRDGDGTPVVVYGSYNGGELVSTTTPGVNYTAAGTWEEDRIVRARCLSNALSVSEDRAVPPANE